MSRAPKPCPDCGGLRPYRKRICGNCLAKRKQAQLDAKRKPCVGCGGPKPVGPARRLCNACAQLAVNSPYKNYGCSACGEPKAPGHGKRLCDDCRELHEWRNKKREQARYAMKRTPCRGCGGVKGPGKTGYCPACNAKRKIVSCRRCKQPKPARTGSLLCEACIPFKQHGGKPCIQCGGPKSPGRGKRYCDSCMRSNRVKKKRILRERARIFHRLRAELAGRDLDSIPRLAVINQTVNRIPVEPLRQFVGMLISTRTSRYNGHTTETVCKQLGINDRDWRRWETGESVTVQPKTVETVLAATNALWWEIYDPERYPEAHVAAAKVFTA